VVIDFTVHHPGDVHSFLFDLEGLVSMAGRVYYGMSVERHHPVSLLAHYVLVVVLSTVHHSPTTLQKFFYVYVGRKKYTKYSTHLIIFYDSFSI
jgi:hypothetical protein